MTGFLRRVSATGLFMTLFAVIAVVTLRQYPQVAALEITRTAREFAAAWQSGRLDQLSFDPRSGPGVDEGSGDDVAELTEELASGVSAVDVNRPVRIDLVGQPRGNDDDTSTQTLAVTWDLGAGRSWTYDTDVTMGRTENRLRVIWRPSTVHPYLEQGLRLQARRLLAARAPVQDRANAVLPPSGPRQLAGELLGTVRPADRDLTAIDPGRIAVGDPVGVGGVEEVYDARLAGRAGVEIDIVRARDSNPLQPVVRQAFVLPPVPGKPVVLTLDSAIQSRAEAALSGLTAPAALVAVRVDTGEVLAVADGGRDDQREKGLQGQYPPGAAFRPATMLALTRYAGLTPDSPGDCRPVSYLGQQFTNPPGAPSGNGVPLRTAFTRNCITAFAAAARALTGQQLQQAAQALGYQLPSATGMPTFEGRVPASTEDLERVENAVGEGTVLASPLVVARASATVATGRYEPSQLVSEPLPQLPDKPPALAPGEQVMLQQLMAETVRSDPALAALRGVRTGEVSAIAGTASYGPAADAPTVAWCTGYQADLAFAVLVTDDATSAQAVAAAARFLS